MWSKCIQENVWHSINEMLILCFGSIVPKIGITTTTTNYWTRVVWAIIELINSGSKITAKWLESALNITLESPCNSCANNNNNNINIHTSKIVWHFIRLKVVSCIKIVALFFYSCSQYIYLFCVFPDIYFFSFIRSFVHFFIIFFSSSKYIVSHVLRLRASRELQTW